MKLIYKSILYSFIAFLGLIVLFSCSDDDLPNTGTPSILYVRVTNPDASDSLLAAAGQGSMIAIVGQNLQGARQIWFNDQPGALVSTFITPSSIITKVPSEIPVEITNKLKIIFADGDSLLYDFKLAINKPDIQSMESEFVDSGDTAVIKGDYFYEPLTVTFTGGVTGELIDVGDRMIQVIVPEGAEPGPITITSNFGKTESSLWFRDNRNIILNYDDLTAAGSWRPGVLASEDGLDGNYLKLGDAGLTLNANERIEDPYTSQFWGHNRYAEKTNLVPGSPSDYVLKFEAQVENWYGSYLQICWGPWDNAGNGEVWGNLNGRGIWAPWEENDANFSTNGEWITVSIPISEMKYSQTQEGSNNVWVDDMEFDKDISGTLSFWVVATPDAEASPVEIHIDNVRIVEK